MVAHLPVVGFRRTLFLSRGLFIDARIKVECANFALLLGPDLLLQEMIDPLQVTNIADVELSYNKKVCK